MFRGNKDGDRHLHFQCLAVLQKRFSHLATSQCNHLLKSLLPGICTIMFGHFAIFTGVIIDNRALKRLLNLLTPNFNKSINKEACLYHFKNHCRQLRADSVTDSVMIWSIRILMLMFDGKLEMDVLGSIELSLHEPATGILMLIFRKWQELIALVKPTRLVAQGTIEEKMMQLTRKKMVLEHLVVGKLKTQNCVR
ncbi:hypothetical protein CASFOL_011188 [Castilleja foliolosa]|uniref:Uncharacterized protein n=1 Tax=Castilleja foliolosa TaxID=1961234 RepID=A0ABD3DV66_9LAMI